MNDTPDSPAAALAELGALFHDRGWSYATSSNFSVVLGRSPLRLLITASGKDKRRLGPGDFVVVGEDGRTVDANPPAPSAETPLHVALAGRPDVGAVLHTHSVWGTLLSDLHFRDGGLEITGYEMLKGLAGVDSHEERMRIEIFENTQDMASLGRTIAERLADTKAPLRHGFLIRGHGLYTWGKDLDEARRHVEVFEFLFEVIGRRRGLDRQGG